MVTFLKMVAFYFLIGLGFSLAFGLGGGIAFIILALLALIILSGLHTTKEESKAIDEKNKKVSDQYIDIDYLNNFDD